MFYYAQVDSEYKVIAVTQSDTAIVADNYVEITEEQYISGNLVNEYYNRLTGAFETVFEAMGDTTLVQDGTTQRRLSTKLDNMQVEINGKAEADHTHEEYAEANHTHNYAATTHGHTQSEVEGLGTALANKANTSHTHAQNEVTGLSTALDGKANANHGHSYNELTDKPTIPSAYTHPETHPATMITGLSDVATSGSYEDLTDKPTIPNAYTHPETHSADMITGLSDVATSGSYNDLTDKPTIPGAYTHPATHPASMITGLPTTLPANGGNADTVDGKHASDFAAATHAHSDYATVEEMEAVETAVSGKANTNHTHSDYAANSHTHAQSEITGLATALSGKANTSHTHSEYAATGHNHNTAYAGINHNHDTEYADISHGHTAAEITETTDKKVMTAAERTKLSGIATGANKYTHPSYTAKSSGLYKVTVDATGHVSGATAVTKSDITGLGIPSTNTTYGNATTSAAGLMSTSDKSKLDGIASGANKTTVDSALSSTSTNPVQNKVINSALAGKSSTSHNHDSAYSAKSLQITSDTGAFKYSYTVDDGKNLLTEIVNLSAGVHTIYSQVGVTGNPKTTESWRLMVHKTGSTAIWAIAYGSSGSVYTNYYANTAWHGWCRIYDAVPNPLWTGQMYMNANHTVTPSKPLSECANGWLLLWSDYNAGEGVQNLDFATTTITKKAYNGENWNGHQWLCPVPTYSNESGSEIIVKKLVVYNDKLTGSDINGTSPLNDVALRAVYEF